LEPEGHTLLRKCSEVAALEKFTSSKTQPHSNKLPVCGGAMELFLLSRCCCARLLLSRAFTAPAGGPRAAPGSLAAEKVLWRRRFLKR
jgi:hypothetical protein